MYVNAFYATVRDVCTDTGTRARRCSTECTAVHCGASLMEVGRYE